jgi:hypothetical protein
MFGIGVTSLLKYFYNVQGTGRSAADQICVTRVWCVYGYGRGEGDAIFEIRVERVRSRGACPALTFLLRRTIRDHLRRARSEKILNVFRRIHLRFFQACGLHLAAPPSPRYEGNVGQAPAEVCL